MPVHTHSTGPNVIVPELAVNLCQTAIEGTYRQDKTCEQPLSAKERSRKWDSLNAGPCVKSSNFVSQVSPCAHVLSEDVRM